MFILWTDKPNLDEMCNAARVIYIDLDPTGQIGFSRFKETVLSYSSLYFSLVYLLTMGWQDQGYIYALSLRRWDQGCSKEGDQGNVTSLHYKFNPYYRLPCAAF